MPKQPKVPSASVLSNRVFEALRFFSAVRHGTEPNYVVSPLNPLGFHFVVISFRGGKDPDALYHRRLKFDVRNPRVKTLSGTVVDVDLNLMLKIGSDTSLELTQGNEVLLRLEGFAYLTAKEMRNAMKPRFLPLIESLVKGYVHGSAYPAKVPDRNLPVSKDQLFALAVMSTTHPPLVLLRDAAREALADVNPPLSTGVTSLGLSTATVNLLLDDHIRDLKELLTAGPVLSGTPGLGAKRVKEIVDALDKLGITLRLE